VARRPTSTSRGDSPSSGTSAGGLGRRATLRPEIRAALALEEAGELQEAARVFEFAGEYARAALLRVEHAGTLRDPGERLDVLREGCARNRGETDETRNLHLALAEALIEEAHAAGDPARRRNLELEAARAFEEAQDHARAGELYESLHLLRKAAGAYERGGEIARLELVLEIIDRAEQRDTIQRQLEREIDDAIAFGRRRYAHTLLIEHVRQRGSQADGAAHVPSALVQRLAALETKLLQGHRLALGWGASPRPGDSAARGPTSGRVTTIRGTPQLRIGRAPDAELTLAGPRVSRHHVELRVDASGERPQVVAIDLGSRVGSFWEGQPLAPGKPEPIDGPGELALGMAATLEVHPIGGSPSARMPAQSARGCGAQGALVRVRGSEQWLLFVPEGGPLWLAPDIVVPARLLFDRGYVVLDLASRVAATLGDATLPLGADVELLVGDRISLVDAPLTMEVIA
jgi:tetratricopeptide (TPR) repeat protein